MNSKPTNQKAFYSPRWNICSAPLRKFHGVNSLSLSLSLSRKKVKNLFLNKLFFKPALYLFCAGFLFFSLATSAHAATYYWVGATDGANTSVASNWKTAADSCGTGSGNLTVPTTGDTINFVSNCRNNATVDAALSVDTFTMNSGYTGTTTLAANLTTSAFTVDGGTLYVANAKTLTTTGSVVYIGNASGSNGKVTLDGTGSTWTSAGYFIIGNSGIGNLTITNGATVTSAGTSISPFGNNAGSTATVIVSGTGSTLTLNTSRLYIGTSGTGNISILNGGSLVTNVDRVYIATTVGSSGQVIVDGAGSTWTYPMGHYFGVGNGINSNGKLTISNGGVVNYSNPAGYSMFIAGATGAIGEVIISGAGSQLNISCWNLFVGSVGTGTLTVSNNGYVTTSSQIGIGSSAGSTGTFNIGAGGTAGTVTTYNIVGASGATATLNFNHSDSNYTFSPAISGPVSVNHLGSGTTTLSGANTYTGITTLSAGTLSAGSSTAIGSSTLVMNAGSTLSVPSGNLNIWGNWTNNGATLNLANSTIVLASTTAQAITGSNTFPNLTISAPNTVTFPSGLTQTIGGTFTCLGTAGNLITIKSSTPGSAATLSKSSGLVNCDYLSLTDSAATGGAIWSQGAHSTSVSGNSGWILDITGPTVAVTVPANGAAVSGALVALTATAIDSGSGLASLQFKLDTNTLLGSAGAVSPYSIAWDSTAVSAGSHTIIAVARDNLGNLATSSVITVTVDNTAPISQASIPGATYSDVQTVSLSCTDATSGCSQIYYTTDGSTPTTSSQVYASPIAIYGGYTSLKFFASDLAGNNEGAHTENYAIITGSVPIFSAPPISNLLVAPTNLVPAANINNPPQPSLVREGENLPIAATLDQIQSEALRLAQGRPIVSQTNFINQGTPTTKVLGSGERAGVLSSYRSAFGQSPKTQADWSDVIKIANGRWPSQRNQAQEAQAKLEFKKVYRREAKMNNTNDNAAVTVIAYGLRPGNRNLNSEQSAIKSFKAIYGHTPVSALAWEVVRAIAYSGAKR